MYERYIKKDGRLYGPYTYSSKREGDKIKSVYCGRPETPKNLDNPSNNFSKIFIYFVVFAVFFSALLFLKPNNLPVTGFFTFQYENVTNCTVLNNSNTVYSLLNDVSSTEICFNISEDNITLDCQNYKITGAGANSGIYLDYVSNATVMNCNVSNYTNGIYLSYSTYNQINNVTANGTTSGISLLASSYNAIVNSTAIGAGTGGGTGINLEGAGMSGSNYNNITNCTVDAYEGISIKVRSTNAIISNSTITARSEGIYISEGAGYNTMVNSNITADAGGSSRGITVSFNAPSISNYNTITNCSVRGDTGISLASTRYNNISNSTIYGYNYGLYIDGVPWNMAVYNNVVEDSVINGTFGVVYRGLAGNNKDSSITNSNISGTAVGVMINISQNISLTNVIISPSGTDFFSVNSSICTMTNVTFNSSLYPTKASFTWVGNITINSSDGKANSDNLYNISKFLNITNISSTGPASVFMNISYTSADASNINESTLNMYRHNGTNWLLVNGSTRDSTNKYVYANITGFSIFGLLGKDTNAPTISFSCAPTSVYVGDTITCSCTATDTNDPNPTVSYTAHPSTAIAGTFTTPCTATDNENHSATSSISYTVTAVPSSPPPTPPTPPPSPPPTCTPTCTDCSYSGTCAEMGTKTCTASNCATSSQSCVRDTDGTSCGTNARCVNGVCAPFVCTHECVGGAASCIDSSNYHICGDYNADGCLEWSSPILCGLTETCLGGACIIKETPKEETPTKKEELTTPTTAKESGGGGAGGRGCTPKINCTDISACVVYYDVSGKVRTRQSQTCIDLNKCIFSKIVEMPCQKVTPITVKRITKCSEEHIQIYNSMTGKLIADIKESSAREKPGMDIALATTEMVEEQYCSYCSDGRKDYDEIYKDCGGSCLSCNLDNFVEWRMRENVEMTNIADNGEKIYFTIGGMQHIITIGEITEKEGTVKISISSPEAFDRILQVSKNEEIDINGDGVNEISIRLESIAANKAKIVFKKLIAEKEKINFLLPFINFPYSRNVGISLLTVIMAFLLVYLAQYFQLPIQKLAGPLTSRIKYALNVIKTKAHEEKPVETGVIKTIRKEKAMLAKTEQVIEELEKISKQDKKDIKEIERKIKAEKSRPKLPKIRIKVPKIVRKLFGR